MNADKLIAAIDLPASCLVNQRVPKKMLLENGAPTAADKRLINDGIEELLWLAALKPSTIGVSEYRDEVRDYVEIAVLRLSVRSDAKSTRLAELIHRAVPYPIMLLTEQGGIPSLSAAHKRLSNAEVGRTVLEGGVVAVEWDAERDAQHEATFRGALALGKQPRSTLYALYRGWVDTLLALQAARITGTFAVAVDDERASIRYSALQECARLDALITRLRAAAAKERQMSRRVELNLEVKRVEAVLAAARANL